MKGSVVYLFAFDVANEIHPAKVSTVLGQTPFPYQIRLDAAAPRDVPVYAPLTIRLAPVETASSVGPVTLKPQVKIFDVGALSISYEVVFDKGSLAELVPYHQLKIGEEALSAMAERLALSVAHDLKAAMVKPNPDRPVIEAYTAFCFADVGGPVPEWITAHRAAIAGLLNEEPEPGRLAEQQIEETLEHSLAYTRADYTVVDWDAALVVDTGGYVEDVLYMIELANLQLEEYKLLDDRLDKLFMLAYEDLERRTSVWRFAFTREPRLEVIHRTRMDMAKMSEEVSNITKFVGDWYLARIYLACKTRFHLGQWEASVDQKLAELNQLYTVAHQDTNERRMLILELIVIALFVFEVVAAFTIKH
jgi:hypothetical protein